MGKLAFLPEWVGAWLSPVPLDLRSQPPGLPQYSSWMEPGTPANILSGAHHEPTSLGFKVFVHPVCGEKEKGEETDYREKGTATEQCWEPQGPHGSVLANARTHVLRLP